MNIKKIIYLSIVTLLVLSLAGFAPSLYAGDDKEKKKDDEFFGSFLFGYRMVDTEGMETKYKEDINLDQGARLFNFNLHYVPTGSQKKIVDRIDVSLNNFGGDPFETLGIQAIKYGKYQFRYNRRKATYFYNDMLEAGDMHHFNFDRITDSGYLKVWLSKSFQFYVDFSNYTKKGDSVTTIDVQRVEFEYEKPIDETATDIAFGISYAVKGFSIVLEEKIQDYDNVNSLFLPGYADGGSHSSYPTALKYMSLDQPYNLETYTHTARVSANPMKNLYVKGRAQFSNQDMEMTYSEMAAGVGYTGHDFMYGSAGDGEFSRKIQLFDFDATYILNNKFALVVAARYNKFEQSGSMTVDGETMPMELNYESGGVEGGLQFQPTSKFSITAGFRVEKRDIEYEYELDENAPTERTGFFGNIAFKGKAFRLTADYQYGSYENPLTMISPTDFHRFRLTLKYKKKGFYGSGSYLYNKTESKMDSATYWETDKNQFNLRFGYHGKKVNFSAGYGLMDISRQGDRMIYYPPYYSGGEGSFMWDILFEGETHLFDASLYFKIDKAWGLGAYFNYYDNKGSWELSRTTLKAYLKYMFDCGFITHLGYRLVDFQEKEYGYNDYKANIFELSLGYRW